MRIKRCIAVFVCNKHIITEADMIGGLGNGAGICCVDICSEWCGNIYSSVIAAAADTEIRRNDILALNGPLIGRAFA